MVGFGDGGEQMSGRCWRGGDKLLTCVWLPEEEVTWRWKTTYR